MVSKYQTTAADAAEVLFNVGTVLELAEETPYRVRAYRNAARLLLAHQPGEPFSLAGVNGMGRRLRQKIEAIVEGQDSA